MSRTVAAILFLALVAAPATAKAQSRRGSRPPPQQSAPKPAPSADDEDSQPAPRTEPEVAPPADPLAIPPEVAARIGSDWTHGPPAPEGAASTSVFPIYERREGDMRLRLLPPFLIEQTRGLRDPSQALYGVPKTEDTQGLYGLLYYQRRSLQLDMDVVFPAIWRVRDHDSHTLVLGPLVHREAPGENDNWLAPLYFAGGRKDGGYFHSPLLLTTTHWNTEGAFTLVGPYFRNRSATNVDAGIVPFYFHGDNGNTEGNRASYTVIPPLLFYHGAHELDGSSTTVVGPVIAQSDLKRDTFDVAPLFFHIKGKPETGGVAEEHTTLLPFFHYGHDPDSSLFILPGYYRRVTRQSDTLLSLLYSHAESHNGAQTLTAAGPVVPLWWEYRDRDLGVHTWALAPFYMNSQSPTEHDWLTPLVGHFETYGQSSTWWILPSFTFQSSTHGWEDDFHPLVYVGRSDDSSHTVIAPIFWDFADKKGRTTVGFPLYWRFADTKNDSVLQVAANTVYVQKRVVGGLDWEFHFAPLFSYGENPNGYFWNILFGLAGYSQYATGAQVRALWLPIDINGGNTSPTPRAATATAK